MRQLRRLFQISPGELVKTLPKLDLARAGSVRDARLDAGLPVGVVAVVDLTVAEAAVPAVAVRAEVWGRTGGLPVCLLGVFIFTL